MQTIAQMETATDSSSAAIEAFAHQALGDVAGALTTALVVIGDKLGLYRELAKRPASPAELAARTGTTERYVREWLNAQAAAGYVTYESGRYALPAAHAACLADPESPACVLGAFQAMLAATRAVEPVAAGFRSGRGVGWHEHDSELFVGVERFFRPGYNAHLVSEWIPALDGVQEKLTCGGWVADIGCGLGASTIILAKAFPRSRFIGFDYHRPSIEQARERAREAGLADRVVFEVASSTAFPGEGYDLVTFFDCLHDMGDPVGAARHVRQVLAPDGTWMIVEPYARDRVEENLTPVGRLFYSVSTLVCTPASLAQDVGLALGAQAGEARLRTVLEQAGFPRIRRATETPFNIVLEARL
jgi:SAM-dependent methyltransferase